MLLTICSGYWDKGQREILSVSKDPLVGHQGTQMATLYLEVMRFSDVNRKKKKKDLSTGTATLQTVQGVNMHLQAAYQHFVSNTPGNMEKETLELVFKELAKTVMEDLEIEGSLETM